METEEREFLQTHPWLTFKLDARRFDHEVWMLLGSVTAKCAQLEGVPLKPNIAKRMHEAVFIKGAHGTTAIEGNTLSEEQVRDIYRDEQLELPLSLENERREAANAIAQFNEIGQQVLKEESTGELTVGLIVESNGALLKDIELLPEAGTPGTVRKHSVGVEGVNYRGAPWRDCPFLLKRLCQWLNELSLGPAEEDKVPSAILRALLVHLYIAWIHPFGDGNGRTARLMEFYVLTHGGVPHLAVHLLSNYYHLTRPAYYKALDYSSKSGEGVVSFLKYALRGFGQELDEQLRIVRMQHILIAWADLINERFPGHSAAIVRRKHVVLALSGKVEPVRRKDIRFLDPTVAHYYGGKTDKTITRDLNVLKKMELVRREGGGYLANFELILAFLS